MTACIAIEILHPDTHFPVSTESSLSINRKKITQFSEETPLWLSI